MMINTRKYAFFMMIVTEIKKKDKSKQHKIIYTSEGAFLWWLWQGFIKNGELKQYRIIYVNENYSFMINMAQLSRIPVVGT